jgi:hypothetical protein
MTHYTNEMCTAALRVSFLACKPACCKRYCVTVIFIAYLVFSVCIPTLDLWGPCKIHAYFFVPSISMIHEYFRSLAIWRRGDWYVRYERCGVACYRLLASSPRIIYDYVFKLIIVCFFTKFLARFCWTQLLRTIRKCWPLDVLLMNCLVEQKDVRNMGGAWNIVKKRENTVIVNSGSLVGFSVCLQNKMTC